MRWLTRLMLTHSIWPESVIEHHRRHIHLCHPRDKPEDPWRQGLRSSRWARCVDLGSCGIQLALRPLLGTAAARQ